MYACLLDRWIAPDPSAAADVIRSMINDRLAIGLIDPPTFDLPSVLTVGSRAVVALERGTDEPYMKRLAEVCMRLSKLKIVEVRETNLVGRLDPIP